MQPLRWRSGTHLLDGAHNPHAARILWETWQQEFSHIKLKPVIVFGAIESKDLEGVCEQLVKLTDTIVFTAVNSPRSISLEEVAGLKCMEGIELIDGSDLSTAMELARGMQRPVLVTGSLYLLGEYKGLAVSRSHRATSQ